MRNRRFTSAIISIAIFIAIMFTPITAGAAVVSASHAVQNATSSTVLSPRLLKAKPLTKAAQRALRMALGILTFRELKATSPTPTPATSPAPAPGVAPPTPAPAPAPVVTPPTPAPAPAPVVAPPTPAPVAPTSWNPNDGTGVTQWEYTQWAQVNICEEGGNWHTEGSSFPGGLGILAANWEAYGGQATYGTEASATPDQQIAIAIRINGRGTAPAQDMPPACAGW